jgi:hypothetical protein
MTTFAHDNAVGLWVTQHGFVTKGFMAAVNLLLPEPLDYRIVPDAFIVDSDGICVLEVIVHGDVSDFKKAAYADIGWALDYEGLAFGIMVCSVHPITGAMSLRDVSDGV